METKAFAAAVEVKNEAAGTFTALVCSFDKLDRSGDIVKSGAFARSISQLRASGGRLPVVFDHRHGDPQLIVGECDPDGLVETPIGLEARGRFYLDEAPGKKVFKQLQRRTLRDWSFGFVAKKAKQLAAGTRELWELDLLELGPTLRGAGDTLTLDVKADVSHDAETDVLPGGKTYSRLEAARVRLDLARRTVELDRARRR